MIVMTQFLAARSEAPGWLLDQQDAAAAEAVGMLALDLQGVPLRHPGPPARSLRDAVLRNTRAWCAHLDDGILFAFVDHGGLG
jgi:hypothetical protein